MKKFLVILLWAHLGCPTPSLSQAVTAWRLSDCISYALAHSTDLQRSHIDADQGRYNERTARLDFLPTVTGQVSGQYAWGRNIDPETNTYNTITTFNNYYSVGAEMTLFDGGQTLNALRRARNARRQAETALEKAAYDKTLTVMTKFVDALYNQQSVALAQEKLADSRALLHKTQRLFELGEKSRPDVAQMESQVAEDDYNLLHQQNQARLTLLALQSEMGWEATTHTPATPPQPSPKGEGVQQPSTTGKETVTNTDTGKDTNTDTGKDTGKDSMILSLEGLNLPYTQLTSSNSNSGHPTGIASPSPLGEDRGRVAGLGGVAGLDRVTLAQQNVNDKRYAYLIARGQLLPTLSVGGGVSTNYYRNLSYGSGSADPFGRQMHNNLGEYVYLSLSIPIFTPSRWRSARQAKSEWKKAQLDLDDARRRLNDDLMQATADRNGYRREITQMERKVAADSLAYHLSTRKYEEGMLSTFDLHTAAETLLESRIKLLQTRLLLVVKEWVVESLNVR